MTRSSVKIVDSGCELRDYEKELCRRELESFIPDKIFDSHVHIFNKKYFSGEFPEEIAKIAVDNVNIGRYRGHMEEIMPGRKIIGLFIGRVKTSENFDVDLDRNNKFVSEQVKENSNCRGLMVVTPDMDSEFIRQEVKRLKLSGLKCYCFYSPKKPSYSADIQDYLPEEQVKVANDENLAITLHLVKERGLADKKNQETIIRYCKKYPNMKMILAHCGRGFNPYLVLEGISALRGISNIWFDTSVITESATFEIIVREAGHSRLLYGSDFPCSLFKGTSFAVGDSFLWLDESNIEKISNSVSYANIKPVTIGIESLRCLKLAALNLKLSDNQIEDIFYNNARGLFDLKA
jgi:predicted TIM-barrel fold metal-dependent hydrolase